MFTWQGCDHSRLLQVPQHSSVDNVHSEERTQAVARQQPLEETQQGKESGSSEGSVAIDVVAGPVALVRPGLMHSW